MTTTATAIRWMPTGNTPELPLSAFNMTWSADGRIVCEGLYPAELNPPSKGIVMSFENTHAFMSFDEYSDYLEGISVDVPALAEPVPYGGCWPFIEILSSPWLAEVSERDGGLKIADFRHWAILTRNQTLHVMAHFSKEPIFERWLQ